MKYYSVHFNRPDFLPIQTQYLDGELIVINNHCNPRIEAMCLELGLECHNLPNYYSESQSHAYALNFLKTIIDYSDDYCIIDHDLFPYKPIVFGDYDVVAVKSLNNPAMPYLWPGFIAGRKHIRLDDFNFEPVLIPDGDTGCDTYRLVQQLGNKIHYCTEKYIGDKTNTYMQMSPVVSQFDDYCIHYLNGSNWMEASSEVIEQKNSLIIQLLNDLK